MMRDAIQIVNKFLLTGTVHLIDPIHTPIDPYQNTKDEGFMDNETWSSVTAWKLKVVSVGTEIEFDGPRADFRF